MTRNATLATKKNNGIMKANKKESNICMRRAIHQHSQEVRHNIPENKNIFLRTKLQRSTVTPP